jgi:hypothetical protein
MRKTPTGNGETRKGMYLKRDPVMTHVAFIKRLLNEVVFFRQRSLKD